jgi:hypothetical protein
MVKLEDQAEVAHLFAVVEQQETFHQQLLHKEILELMEQVLKAAEAAELILLVQVKLEDQEKQLQLPDHRLPMVAVAEVVLTDHPDLLEDQADQVAAEMAHTQVLEHQVKPDKLTLAVAAEAREEFPVYHLEDQVHLADQVLLY